MSLRPTAEAWPVIFVVGLGCALSGYVSYRTLSTHNDITIDKKKPYQFRTKGMAKFNGYGSENLEWDADKQKWIHPK